MMVAIIVFMSIGVLSAVAGTISLIYEDYTRGMMLLMVAFVLLVVGGSFIEKYSFLETSGDLRVAHQNIEIIEEKLVKIEKEIIDTIKEYSDIELKTIKEAEKASDGVESLIRNYPELKSSVLYQDLISTRKQYANMLLEQKGNYNYNLIVLENMKNRPFTRSALRNYEIPILE